MAIYWRLDKVLSEKGVTAWELAHRLGVAHPSIYRLVKQKHITRITVHDGTLDAICEALKCEPGDLLVYRKR